MTWPPSSCSEGPGLPGGAQGPLAPGQGRLHPAVPGPRKARAQHPMGLAAGRPCIYQWWDPEWVTVPLSVLLVTRAPHMCLSLLSCWERCTL